MTRKALTEKAVEAANSAGKPQVEHFDAMCPGLSLRVTKQGKKTWNFMYRSPRDQKNARIKLGTYPATGLKAARDKAVAMRGKIESGTDPRDAAPPSPGDITVDDLIAERMKPEAAGALRSADEIRRRLAKNVSPVVGSVLVKDFKKWHLNQIVGPILERGAQIEANRVYQDVRALMNFAVEQDIIEYNPIDKAKRPSVERARDRFLSNEEIVAVWRGLPGAMARSTHVPTILRLCLVTGQRLTEVAGISRGEIDLFKRVWTIPPERAKNGRVHDVHLSDLAMELLREAMRETNGDYLFPNEEGDGHLLNYAVDRTVSRAQAARKGMPLGKFGIPKWCPHDLRRTAATGMQALGVPIEVTEAVLNHVSGKRGGLVGIYQRYRYTNERREALDKWSAFLSQLVDPNKVVSIEQGRVA